MFCFIDLYCLQLCTVLVCVVWLGVPPMFFSPFWSLSIKKKKNMWWGKAVLLPEEKRKKKWTLQKRETAAPTIHFKEAKEETNTCSLQVAFKVPDSGVYTWYRALLESWCFLSALRDGRFFLHTSCSELLGGTEDIELTGNESQLLGDGSWVRIMMFSPEARIVGYDGFKPPFLYWLGHQPACGMRNSIWLVLF